MDNEKMISNEQRRQLEEVSKPLVEWLRANCHPMHTIIIDVDTVELLEGQATVMVRK